MASFTLTGFSSTTQNLNDGDTGFVGVNASLVTPNDNAISGAGNNDLMILGAVGTFDMFDSAIDLNSGNHNILIGENGYVSAVDDAIRLSGGVNFSNAGTVVSAGREALEFGNDDGASFHEIRNSGLIDAGRSGIVLNPSDGTDMSFGSQGIALTNTGTISASLNAITNASGASEFARATITNTGEIISSAFESYRGSAGVEVIRNSGTMVGGIELNGNTDSYLGASGFVEGLISGGDGDDTLFGGSLTDEIAGDADNDTIDGRGGNDMLFGGGGEDTLQGGDGNDLVRGGADEDVLRAGRGDDNMGAGGGDDVARGNAGDDVVGGGSGADRIFGGLGDDLMLGGGGNDRIHGGKGDDTLTGDQGADVFHFVRRDGENRITDFQNGIDTIDLSAFGLRPAQFNSVVAAALNNAGGGDTFLDFEALGGTGSVLIEGLAFGQADASDFVL